MELKSQNAICKMADFLNLIFLSPDGKFLVFLSARASVDSGAHSSTDSLHRIEWPTDGKLSSSLDIVDVVSFLFLIA